MDNLSRTSLIAQDGAGRALKVEWLNLPESWGVFVFLCVVILLLGLVVFWYIREMKTCPPAIRGVLAAIRIAVVVLLIIAYLKPSVSYVEQRTRKPNLVLMNDVSQSMSIADTYPDDTLAARIAKACGVSVDELRAGDLSRVDLAELALKQNNEVVLDELRERGSIRIFQFSGDAEQLVTLPAIFEDQPQDESNSTDESESSEGDDSGRTIGKAGYPELDPIGSRTDIRQALKSALNVSQLQAIVLVSDGQHTSADVPTDVAEEAAELGIPIYVIGVGDPRRIRNVSVSEVWVLTKARPGEPFDIDFLLNGEDVQGQTVNVQLVRQTVNEESGDLGEETVLDRKTVTFTEESGNIRDQFRRSEDEVGKFRYTIRVSGIENDEEPDDNERVSDEVDVTKESVKVLLIAGAPTWEYRMVQRLYQRDQNITLSCWLQSMDEERTQEGDVSISRLPQNYEELAEYNVIMMFDPDPRDFGEKWMDELKRFSSEKAGGVLFMAGPKFTTDFLTLPRTQGLKEVLPVQIGNAADTEVAQILASTNSLAGKLEVVQPNIDHQILKFPGDRNQNLELWDNLPGIYWSYPAAKAKPTTQTLVEHGDITLSADGEHARPLIVAGRYGAGNTVYLGFTGTWRWRRVGRQAEYFDRFWIQVCNHLVNTRSIQGLRRGTLDPDRDEYEVGDQIELAARLLDPRYEPLELPEVDARITINGNQIVPIKLFQIPEQAGDYRASFPARQLGSYEIQVDLPSATEEQRVDPVVVSVRPPQIESRAKWLNEPLLQEIAEKSGGKYFHLDEIDGIAGEVPIQSTTIEWQTLPEPVWSFKRLFEIMALIVPVMLLGLEWAIRKAYKLL